MKLFSVYLPQELISTRDKTISQVNLMKYFIVSSIQYTSSNMCERYSIPKQDIVKDLWTLEHYTQTSVLMIFTEKCTWKS